MGGLTAVELLDAWEQGLTRPLPERVLTLLAAAYPGEAVDELAALPIGRRDRRLLRLRERLFGPQLVAVAPCPACGDHVESSFHVDDICLAEAAAFEPWYSADVNGCSVTFRLPTTRDLLAHSDADAVQRALLARCLGDARGPNGDVVPADALPGEVIAAIEARMAVADPQAVVELSLECSACGHHWLSVFDIASFLWKEVHAWALRTLRDVHHLARSYGWREADVLALSPTRRQLYLELNWQ